MIARIHAPRLIFAPLLALTLLVTGCASTQQGGKDLSAAGVKTANALADYYDQLADYALDVPELTAVEQGLSGEIEAKQSKETLKTVTEAYERISRGFHARAAMARSLAGLYVSLGNLAAYDARGAAGGAAKNLSDSITSLPSVSESIDANPGDLINMITGDLAALQQAGDLRKASDLTAAVLAHVADFVDRERGAGGKTDLYGEVLDRRAKLVGMVARRLVEKKYVDATTILKGVGDEFEIPWSGEIAGDDKATPLAAAAVASAQARRQAGLASAAGGDVVAALRALAAQHKAYAQGGAFNPADAEALAARAQAYVDEIEKLKKEARETRAARREEARKKATTKPNA